ncbi:MAG TPA: hypothetical protein VI299_15775, partial [Polyangiales bacterium]
LGDAATRDDAALRDAAMQGDADAESPVEHDAAAPTDAAQGDPCSGVVCSSPPASTCDGNTLVSYSFAGSCVSGTCTYPQQTTPCQQGCANGQCTRSVCTPGAAVFSHDITDVDALFAVSPLPALSGSAAYEVRSFMQFKDSYIDVSVPIYAPADGRIVAASHYRDPLHSPSDTSYMGEWGLVFEATCTTSVTLAHVHDVPQAVADALGQSTGGSGLLQLDTPIPLHAGDVLGHYVRGVGYGAWDFVVLDQSVTNTFVNQDRFVDADLKYLHAICPFDPFVPELRQRYYGLLGTTSDPPVQSRSCGTVAHDKLGTAAGLWFHLPYARGQGLDARSTTGNPFSLFSAVFGSVFVADLDGTAVAPGFLTFRIDPENPTFRDPETITTSHCYERRDGPGGSASGWAFVHVVSDTELDLAYDVTGACPQQMPTSGVTRLYR